LSVNTNRDGLVKGPDAALRFIIRHCDVRQVRLVPHDLHALPAAFLQGRLRIVIYPAFYESINRCRLFILPLHKVLLLLYA